MATLQRISHGEPNWDIKVNAIIDELEKTQGSVGNVAKNMDWKVGKDGIVIINDYFRLGTDSSYAYLEIGGKRLVHLYLDIFATKDFTGSMTGSVLTLPNTIAPQSPMNGVANERYTWSFTGKLGFNAYGNNSSTSMKSGDQFTVDKTYVLD